MHVGRAGSEGGPGIRLLPHWKACARPSGQPDAIVSRMGTSRHSLCPAGSCGTAGTGPAHCVVMPSSPRDTHRPPGAGHPPQHLPQALGPRLCSSWAAIPQGFLEPLQAVEGEGTVLAGLQEALHVGQQDVAGGEEAGAQPEQLPATLLAVPAGRG